MLSEVLQQRIAVSFGGKYEFFANNLSADKLTACHFPIGFKNEMNRFFEILACFVECTPLRVRSRQLFYVANPPVTLVIEDSGKFLHKGIPLFLRASCASHWTMARTYSLPSQPNTMHPMIRPATEGIEVR